MNPGEAVTSSHPAGATPGGLTARALGWGEVFILIPLHAFWILHKSTPFVAENTSSAFVAAVPLGAMAAVGLAARHRAIGSVVVGLEWLLHLSATICMTILLFYVALRDPFDPIIPITWPLCFWSIAVTFAITADLLLHERLRGRCTDSGSPVGCIRSIIVGLALWVVLVWIAVGMTWTPYFLTVSIVFHAIMARAARRACGLHTSRITTRSSPWNTLATLVESLFAVALMLTALLRFLFTCHMTGTAELKYFQMVDIAISLWFPAGAALALLASRFRFPLLAHALTVAVLLLSDESSTWPVPFVIGYGLPVLFLASTRQGPLAYSLSAAATAIMWVLGAFCFTLAGVIVVFQVGLASAKALDANMRIASLVLYVVWLALTGISLWKPNCRLPTTFDVTPISGLFRNLTYTAVCLLILTPVVCLIVTTMWPPVWFNRPPRVDVGEPAGICHAGYSRSDEEYATLHKLGARLTRVPFAWDRIQPRPDTWNFEDLDAYVAAANSHQMKVLAVLAFDNNNVEHSPSGSKRNCYIAPEDIPLFLEYVRRTVTRYKNRVYAWEIWNEPDLPAFWTGTAAEFYELARQAAEAARQADPSARLLGTAMTSGIGAMTAGGIEGLHTSGALKQVDQPTVHTYISDPRGYYNEFLRIRNAAAKHGHPGSIWITELGDPDGGVYPWRVSSDLLAEHVIKSFTIATSLGIEKLLWHCSNDAELDSQRMSPDNSEGFFGLLGPAGQWKPAAYAYRLFAGNCTNTVIRTDLVEASGGIAARQIRAALYRRDDAQSTLILWFEPSLRPGTHARVTIDLGPLEQPAVMHDITSGYTKHLLDSVIDVTEKPLFITYKTPTPQTPAHLHVDSSPADAMWLLSAIALVLLALWSPAPIP